MRARDVAPSLIDEEINLFTALTRGGIPFKADEMDIMRAIARGNYEEFSSLLLHTKWPLETMTRISIRACAFFGQLKLFEQLLPSKTDKLDTTCLILAARRGHLDLVKFILKNSRYEIIDCMPELESALCFAAENGHLEIVNFFIKEFDISPNQDYLPLKARQNSKLYRRCKALYLAACAGHIDVVLSLLNDPRTSYFDLETLDHNSPNEKVYIIALAVVSKVLLDETLDPRVKRKVLFETANKLLIRNQKKDLERLFEEIPSIIESKLYKSCYGKKAPSEMRSGQLQDFIYCPSHTEITLLLDSEVEVQSDGRIRITYDKSRNSYSRHYSKSLHSPLDLVAELTYFIPTLGYELSTLDEDSFTFSPESSLALKEVRCLHFNTSYLRNLVYLQNGLTLFYDFYRLLNEWIQMPKELWGLIADYFMEVMHKISISVAIDPTDEPLLIARDSSSADELLLPPTKNVSQASVELPLNEPKALNKIELCQIIYKALYKGQSSFFKHWNSDLMDKTPENEKVITDHIAENRHSRTAIAWNLTNQFIDGNLTKKELFIEIHKEAYKNSSNLGIFRQSVFELSYTKLDERITKARNGKELEGTRTKEIIDVLDSYPSLRM